MDEGTRESRTKLIRALDNLGYGCRETCNLDELADIIPCYILDKVEGTISDFVVIPNEEGDSEGLAQGNAYRIYVKEK